MTPATIKILIKLGMTKKKNLDPIDEVNPKDVDAVEQEDTGVTPSPAENIETTEASDNEESSDEEDKEKREVKALYDVKTKVAVASTDVVDRHGERIDQDGWELKNFKTNPVMLWAHDHSEIAVGNARNIHIERAGGTPRLVFTPDFHTETPKAKALKALYDQGRLNSFSVGFVPKDFDGKDATYLKQELLEISAVNVPANPEARMLAYKSLVKEGFDKAVAKEVTGADETADNGEEEPKEVEDQEVPEGKSVSDLMAIYKELFEKDNKFIDIMKAQRGAVQDEIDAEELAEAKSKQMRSVHEVYWAFCDVFYSEETALDDFSNLLKEMIGILGKVADGTYQAPGNPDEAPVEDAIEPDKEKEVLDKDSDNDEDDNNKVKAQENKETSAAPETQKHARAKQSLSKVIARATDKILQSEDKSSQEVENLNKIVKRAAEILNSSHKRDK